MTTDEYREKIVNWLDAPDPSLNHNKACQARQPKTGLWLLNSNEYQNWRSETGTFLWLHGIRKYRSLYLSAFENYSPTYHSWLREDNPQVSKLSHR